MSRIKTQNRGDVIIIDMRSVREDIKLLPPDVDRDATFALAWFSRSEGRQTLLSMGNTEDDIEESTIKGERKIMQDFLELEKAGKQITRVIVVEENTIGVVWIEHFENHGVKSPSIHIMIGNPDFRGKGIGRAVMQSVIEHIRSTLKADAIYSRHLSANTTVARLNESLGFMKDGDTYEDDNGLVWQNVVMML